MSRQQHEREDLLREATALVPRVQLKTPAGEVFAGFRGEALSLYFDADPVYHFNGDRELRRAYREGQLIKADAGELVAWLPQRGETRTDMLRHDLTPEETEQFQIMFQGKLESLRQALEGNEYSVLGEFPDKGGALERLVTWLAEFTGLRIASSPHVGR